MRGLLKNLAAVLFFALSLSASAQDHTPPGVGATLGGRLPFKNVVIPSGGSFIANGSPLTFYVLSGGAGGSGASSTTDPGGGGAGGCRITLTPAAGTTVFFSVGGKGTGSTVVGSNGGTSWVNIASNAQPTLSTQGCYATGGQGATSGSPAAGQGFLGDVNYSGVSGSTTPDNGGAAPTISSKGKGGFPLWPGGIGGIGIAGAGTGGNGGCPGGGGGGAGAGTGGDGCGGFIVFTY